MTNSTKRTETVSSPPSFPPSIPNPLHAAKSRMLRRPLLIASLGNPPPQYRNTLHSAGHTLLSSLQRHLSYPPFAKSRLHGNGLLSSGDDNITLWQSPTLMNVSGPALAAAWKTFLRDLPNEDRTRATLVVVHDELESPLGKIKLKIGGSARGHNGLKSCVSSLGGMAFTRIGIGIGRPESRESRDVANYVLRKMSAVEVQKVNEGVEDVVEILTKMQE